MDHSKMSPSTPVMEEPHATPEPMSLDIRHTAGEWVAIITIIAGALAGGAALLLGARHT